jgi:ribosomal protein S20
VRENNVKKLVKQVRRTPNAKNLTAAFSALDKAAKVKVMHPNRAARLKSRLSKLLAAK